MRPTNTSIFGDTVNYVVYYNGFQAGYTDALNTDDEWVWSHLMYYCSQIMDVSGFFTIISLGYWGFTLAACRRLTRNNVYVSLLFCMGALSFYSYGINGIRNGLACSMVLYAFSFLCGSKIDKIKALIIAFFAYNIHHSTALPIFMAIVSIYVIRKFKTAYIFWILSILVSLIAGGAISSFFAGLGFDDRLSYLSTEPKLGEFSSVGFRWDFLVYSAMPIILGVYIAIKKGIKDRLYFILINTYTLSNAFWVMVIRASYSNRFAYLSWFLYPIVLAYPLMKMDVWGKDQGKRASQIMLAHIGFTWFMQTFYWK